MNGGEIIVKSMENKVLTAYSVFLVKVSLVLDALQTSSIETVLAQVRRWRG